MKRKLTIGIDVDGVLADTETPTLKLMERDFGVAILPNEVTAWDYVSRACNTSSSQYLRRMDEAWRGGQVEISDITLPQLLKKIHKEFYISIITKRTRPSFPYVCMWLDGYDIPYDSLLFVGGSQPKLSYPIDILIDDSPFIIDESTRYKNKLIFLVTKPYNDRMQTSHVTNLTRVSSLVHALESIESLERREWDA